MAKILKSSDIQQVMFQIQDIYFRKGTKQEVFDHLSKSNITFDDLMVTLLLDEDEKKIDLLVSFFDLLSKFEGFDDDVINLILKEADTNKSNLFSIKSEGGKKFFLKFIKLHHDKLINKPFMNEFFKIYFMDKSSGVYSQTLQLLIY